MREIRITEALAGQRLDKFLRRYLPNARSGLLYSSLRKKNIVLNDRKAQGGELLKAGDLVRIYFRDETLDQMMEHARPRDAAPLDPSWIVYEDAFVLAINKPAGILSQQRRAGEISLSEMLKAYLDQADRNLYHAALSNRLDRNTSGLVLAGKDLAASSELSRLIRERRIKKYYLALASGVIKEARKLSDTIVRDEQRLVSKVRSDKGGVRAELLYEPLARYEIDGEVCTLLRIQLLTGRTHQIRAQMSAFGHALVGDPKYGKRHPRLKRQFLHAYEIRFPTIEGRLSALSEKTIRADLPDDLKALTGSAF